MQIGRASIQQDRRDDAVALHVPADGRAEKLPITRRFPDVPLMSAQRTEQLGAFVAGPQRGTFFRRDNEAQCVCDRVRILCLEMLS